MWELDRTGPPREEIDSRNWLQDAEARSKLSSAAAGTAKKGKIVSPTASEKCIKELEGEVAQLKRQAMDMQGVGQAERLGIQ